MLILKESEFTFEILTVFRIVSKKQISPLFKKKGDPFDKSNYSLLAFYL